MKIALGLSYSGTFYKGWQTQSNFLTVQAEVEKALSQIAGQKISTICAGRTDAKVHALMQVIHFDTKNIKRPLNAWLRGTNSFLPSDIAINWAKEVASNFDARFCAIVRSYSYILLQSKIRSSLENGKVGWTFNNLDKNLMQQASNFLIGTHDFSAFRSSQCQAKSPIRTLFKIEINFLGRDNVGYWRFDFEGNAFLHHMIRNIMSCLVFVGKKNKNPEWIKKVLESRNRQLAAPTFSPDGLYFVGPTYEDSWNLPKSTPSFDWLPKIK